MEQRVAVLVLKQMGYSVEHVEQTVWLVTLPSGGQALGGPIVVGESMLLSLARQHYDEYRKQVST